MAYKSAVTRHILVIDDDVDILRGLSRRLESQGLRVTTAPNGEAGLAEAEKSRPSAVLLDINMPGVDGLTVLDRLKNDKKTTDIPVLIYSANAQERVQKETLRRGAAVFLAKPCRPENLMHALNLACRGAADA